MYQLIKLSQHVFTKLISFIIYVLYKKYDNIIKYKKNYKNFTNKNTRFLLCFKYFEVK